MQWRPYAIYWPVDLAIETAQATADAREIVDKTRKLLEETVPDTFLGRRLHEMILLPHEQE
jgi:hypothetical protein